MNREKLEQIADRHNDWEGDPMGLNSIHDFLSIPEGLDTETLRTIRRAVENKIAITLGCHSGDPTQIWESWCNEEIKCDFSEIQSILDED